MNPHDTRAWQNAVLNEVFAGIAASEALTDILIFKGARVLARHLPDTARQSLDIDANCSREFLASYPDRQAQATALQGHFSTAIRSQFERGSPVQYQLEDVRVIPQPPKDHPRGWNAFEVQLRVSDMSRASQRGIPNLLIDIAHPEELTADSTTTLEIGGNEIRAYALHRIAGEKVRAFLSSLPEYQAKTGRSGNIIRAKDIDEALEVENASPYGNAASVFTESGGTARYVMEHASAGMVGVNVGVPVPREPFSFGGWNDSKFGVGDITGRGSIEFWTQAKKMTTKWNREAGTNWMS